MAREFCTTSSVHSITQNLFTCSRFTAQRACTAASAPLLFACAVPLIACSGIAASTGSRFQQGIDVVSAVFRGLSGCLRGSIRIIRVHDAALWRPGDLT